MRIYRVYAGADGESHIEEIHLEKPPELGALMHVAQVGIHECSARRTMDFHPLTERRLIIHLRGEVEIGVSDGRMQMLRPGDARPMEDTASRGHTHQDLNPVTQAVVVLNDGRPAGTPRPCWAYASDQGEQGHREPYRGKFGIRV
jgi:hypothetical protein